LPAWTFQVLVTRGFYAGQRYWLPSILGTLISLLLIPLYVVLSEQLGFQGLALAGSISMTLFTCLLTGLYYGHVKRYDQTLQIKPFLKFVGVWSGVCIPMVGLSWGVNQLGIYHASQISSLIELVVISALLGTVGFCLIRGPIRRFTEGPLF